ncbi:hypothetical protein [Nocardia sp. BMG111209]|uniref:hypothetical protein n=1 Tax=Nocardia sp. BMG111209 TaxID=1160137 RepID=UPI0003612545|nr:hypothetical protein [Nocardia sp. BMG111209]
MSTDDASFEKDAAGVPPGSADQTAESVTPPADPAPESATTGDSGKSAAGSADQVPAAEPAEEIAAAEPAEGIAAAAPDTPATGATTDEPVSTDADAAETVPDSGAAERAESGTDAESADPSEAGEPARPGSRRGVLAAAVAGVVLVAAVVTVVVLAVQAHHRQQQLDQRAAATHAACDFGHVFATYSSDHIDDYLKQVSDASTGDWKKQIDETGPQVKKAVVDKKVSSTANDVQCGLKSGSDHDAQVLLLISQTFSSAAAPDSAPNTITAAATVEMRQVGGKWLVAKFDTPALAPQGK